MTEIVMDLNYRALVEARGTLRAAHDALYNRGCTDTDTDARQVLYAGIVAEACEAADKAIFRALNVLASYGGDAEAGRVVQMREWEDADCEVNESDDPQDSA